ncbi:MAG: flavodoxin domain-containing protein [Acidobacteriota bacterium]
MEPKVLVAFATRYGSTEDTARVVASVLGAEGLPVEVQPVDRVTNLQPYSAVVLAAALYMGRLHRKARRFLKTWRTELQQVSVALVVPGPLSDDQAEFTGAQLQLEKELKHFPWLHPVAQKIVGGKWDPANMGWPFRWTLRNQPVRDARNWPAIRSAARELAGILQPVAARRRAG